MAIRRLGEGEAAYLRHREAIANAVVASLMPDGVVKGGSALKIRFGEVGTRATDDFDAARSMELEEFVRAFERSLARGWEGFVGRLVPCDHAHPRNVPEPYIMRPFDVKLAYLGSAWCTVSFELGHNEIGDADDPDYVMPEDANRLLAALGFPGLPPVPMMALHHQIAQKLHGVSEPGSERAHDLIDLQLIASRGEIDWRLTRMTCERLFEYRQGESWPVEIVKGEGWETLYEAQRIGLHAASVLPSVDEAIAWANDLIARIASA